MWCILLQFFKSSIMKFIVIVCGSSIEHSYKHQPTNAVRITYCVFHVWLDCCMSLKLGILDCFNNGEVCQIPPFHPWQPPMRALSGYLRLIAFMSLFIACLNCLFTIKPVHFSLVLQPGPVLFGLLQTNLEFS
jgi:hypothetical protein